MTNKAFAKLTAAQKRVAIAKDVIKRIKAKQYRACSGTWLRVPSVLIPPGTTIPNHEVQKTVQKEPCRCCAVGGVCASIVGITDNEPLQYADDPYCLGVWSSEEAFRIMGKFFSLDQALKIEAAFERRTDYYVDSNVIPKSVQDKLYAFNKFYEDPNDTALRIFRNIVRNKGTFVLPGAKKVSRKKTPARH